jgi:hypothetical protein
MDEVPAQDAVVVLDHFASQADLLAGQRVLIGIQPGDVLSLFEFGYTLTSAGITAAVSSILGCPSGNSIWG